jgi:hypothetical protein
MFEERGKRDRASYSWPRLNIARCCRTATRLTSLSTVSKPGPTTGAKAVHYFDGTSVLTGHLLIKPASLQSKKRIVKRFAGISRERKCNE